MIMYILIFILIFVVLIGILIAFRAKYRENKPVHGLKIAVWIVEILVMVGSCYEINNFVNNIIDPDFTTEWQSREEWQKNGSIGGVPRDREAYKASIMRKRSVDKPVFFILFVSLVAGYYILKKASKEMKTRTVKKINTIANNRRIVGLRVAGLFFISIFALTVPICLSNMPVENTNPAGAIVITYPFGDISSPMTAMMTVGFYLPLAFGVGPYLVFRKLTDIFSFKFCATVTLTLIAILIVAFLLKIPRNSALILGNILGGIPIMVIYAKKIEKAAKILGF